MSGWDEETPLGALDLWGAKEVKLSAVSYDGGMSFLHLRIKEGKRFTDLELDRESAAKLAAIAGDWAKTQK